MALLAYVLPVTPEKADVESMPTPTPSDWKVAVELTP